MKIRENCSKWVISSVVEQLAVNQKVDGSIPSLPLFIQKKRAYNSKVEYTLDKRGVGSSSLPRLTVFTGSEFLNSLLPMFPYLRVSFA